MEKKHGSFLRPACYKKKKYSIQENAKRLSVKKLRGLRDGGPGIITQAKAYMYMKKRGKELKGGNQRTSNKEEDRIMKEQNLRTMVMLKHLQLSPSLPDITIEFRRLPILLPDPEIVSR